MADNVFTLKPGGTQGKPNSLQGDLNRLPSALVPLAVMPLGSLALGKTQR
jgi:hypothetical protein